MIDVAIVVVIVNVVIAVIAVIAVNVVIVVIVVLGHATTTTSSLSLYVTCNVGVLSLFFSHPCFFETEIDSRIIVKHSMTSLKGYQRGITVQ